MTFSSVQFSHSVMSDSLRPHESQHARPSCPTPTLGVHSDSHPSSQWCHPAISSSVIPFSSCLQSLHQGLFQWVNSTHEVAKVHDFAWLFIVAIFHIYEIVHTWHSVIIQYLFQWLICMGIVSFWNLCLCETVRIET